MEGPRDVTASGQLPMFLVNPRTRHNLQRVVQACSGLLLASIVVVCVLTLTIHSSRTRTKLLVTSHLVHNKPVIHTNTLSTDDVFISVKTTSKFHYTRLPVILKTWYTLAPKDITFFTDQDDEELSSVLGDKLVPTPCPLDHSRHALVCKMQHEFNAFLSTNKKWFCHFDDDQYVNVPALLTKLEEYPEDLPWYLGKPSLDKPLEIQDKDSPEFKKMRFWFATGGAGFCLSRSLTEKISAHAAGRKFISVSEKLRLPDDVTMGYIVAILADVELTKLDEFHSHLEPLRLVGNYRNQISFSYTVYPEDNNLLEVGGFSHNKDPTRFLSLHCYLFPSTPWCANSSL